jgi:NAD-dependent SIR2 family protein deacetylase
VHGSLAKVQCEFCKENYPLEQFRDEVRSKIRNIYDTNDEKSPKQSSNINCLKCGKPGVKPATVLYGTNLPSRFFKCVANDFPNETDLLIIAGTSLTVYPACTLVNKVNADTNRLLINRDKVGQELGLKFDNNNHRDIFIEGDCDNGFIELSKNLELFSELYEMKDRMCELSQLNIEIAYLQQKL